METIRVAEKGSSADLEVSGHSAHQKRLRTSPGDEKVGDSEKVVEKWGMYKDKPRPAKEMQEGS